MYISTHKVIPKRLCCKDYLDKFVYSNPFRAGFEFGFSGDDDWEEIVLYEETEDSILLPRNIKLNPLGVSESSFKDRRVLGERVQFISGIKPFPSQVPAIEAMVNTDDGILVAPCGSGKTVMALEAIARVGRTTLVLVHKEFLMYQWADRIKEFLGEDAGIVQGDKWQWKDKNIVIGMLQTLYSQRDKIPEEFINWPGVVISDECLIYDTLVDTDYGDIPIGKIVRDKMKVRVRSYNIESEQFEFKPILNYMEQGKKQTIRLEFDNGKTLTCTKNHLILTKNRGYVEADSLTEEDDIVEIRLVKKEIIGEQEVYDIEVADNHNFVANGVIVHNCHRLSAPTWSRVIGLFPSKRRWGLTASPKRGDGLEFIFHAHMGEVAYTVQGNDLSPQVVFIQTGCHLPTRRYYIRGKIRLPMLITGLTEVEERNKKILTLLIQAAKFGRKILLLTDRVNHVKYLKENFDYNTEGLGITTSLYIGETTQEERKIAERADVIFATSQMAKEGLDIPELDTLFFISVTSSRVTTQQAAGRILRPYPGKKPPLVIDFVDKNDICQNFARKRAGVYARLNYPIKVV